MTTNDKLLAWHFCAEDRRLGYLDGREIIVGETLSVDSEPILCRQGLHASERALDALRYAAGPIVCRVELSGQIVIGDDKACATSRSPIWMADATEVLREFARWCALQAIHLWDAPAVVREYLETGDERHLTAAKDAARDAACAAASASDAAGGTIFTHHRIFWAAETAALATVWAASLASDIFWATVWATAWAASAAGIASLAASAASDAYVAASAASDPTSDAYVAASAISDAQNNHLTIMLEGLEQKVAGKGGGEQ